MSAMSNFDITIRNGRICTANETYYADIGIKDGVIAAIAHNLPAGKKDVDAAVRGGGFDDGGRWYFGCGNRRVWNGVWHGFLSTA